MLRGEGIQLGLTDDALGLRGSFGLTEELTISTSRGWNAGLPPRTSCRMDSSAFYVSTCRHQHIKSSESNILRLPTASTFTCQIINFIIRLSFIERDLSCNHRPLLYFKSSSSLPQELYLQLIRVYYQLLVHLGGKTFM